MQNVWKKCVSIVIIISTLVVLNAIADVLKPNRTSYGSTWDSYLQEEESTIDVLFFGSSLVYCDVVPTIIWQNTGISSYVMAGPEQPMSITEFYVKEACKTQSPQAVVVELNGLFFPKYGGFTKANIGYMPWSSNRLNVTLTSAEKNVFLGLIFPIYEYHDRVFEIQKSEIMNNINPQVDPFAGYTVLYDSQPQGNVTERAYDNDTEVYVEHILALKRISDFCDENNIKLILYLAPSYARVPLELKEDLLNDLKTIEYEVFWDCNDGTWPETNPETDWYDALHYNINGAVIFSEEMAKRLEWSGIEPKNQSNKIWEERVAILNKSFTR